MNFELARYNMIEQQIRPWEVLDSAVLDLLATVRREDFVPPAYRAMAFADAQVPLPCGQVMLEPRVDARLLQELQVQRHERVLEIGAGSGFMAALLGHRAQHVLSLECHAELARMASANLRHAGLANVEVRAVTAAQGAQGSPVHGPFDAIVMSGSVPAVPRGLLEQLKPGGRLLAIVGEEPIMRARLFTHSGNGAFAQTDLFDTVAPRL
ncbi:MAG: protein-L-isoaspartate O-methyltransferase, partial [Rubrivivax sp.]|nr:protein-L-isoaspartate O-methyltransferase [Rubrivivax sp.]